MCRSASTGRGPVAGLILALVTALVLLGSGPASAAPELRLDPGSGPPGSTFTVTGTGFANGAQVEIRWESRTGPVLATANGPEFSVTATVPDAPPNSHPVVAVVRDGGSVSTSGTSFQVTTGPAPANTTTTTAAPEPAPAPTTPPPTAGTPAPPVSDGVTGRTSGLGGGVDPAMPDTGGTAGEVPASALAGAGGASAAEADAAVAAAIAAADAAVAAANAAVGAAGADRAAAGATGAGGAPGAGATVGPDGALLPPGTPAAPGAGAGPGAGARGQDGSAGPGSSRDGDGDGTALGRTSQSSGVLGSPVFLAVGLGLVFAGGIFLAVRNRHRQGPPPTIPST